MKVSPEKRNAIARAMSVSETSIQHIVADLKPAAQTKLLNEYVANVKRELAANRSVVCVAISAAKIVEL